MEEGSRQRFPGGVSGPGLWQDHGGAEGPCRIFCGVLPPGSFHLVEKFFDEMVKEDRSVGNLSGNSHLRDFLLCDDGFW